MSPGDPRGCSKCQTPESACEGGKLYDLPPCCFNCAILHGTTHQGEPGAPQRRQSKPATTPRLALSLSLLMLGLRPPETLHEITT
jgi:hypothetical protein